MKKFLMAAAASALMMLAAPAVATETQETCKPRGSGFTGTVKWFNEVEGFGFIGYAGGSDVFVQVSAFVHGFRTLNQGDRVEFDVVDCARGPVAENVKRLQ